MQRMRRYTYLIILLLLSNFSVASESMISMPPIQQEQSSLPCHQEQLSQTNSSAEADMMECCDCSNCIMSPMLKVENSQCLLDLITPEYFPYSTFYEGDFRAYLYRPPIQL